LRGGRLRRGDHLHGAERAGHDTGFTADTLLFIHLHTVAHPADSTVRAALYTGGVLTVVTGNGAVFVALFHHGDARGKMARAKSMLFIMMRHDARHFAGTTSNAELAVCHNKMIHHGSPAGLNNLILYMNKLFTDRNGLRQCSIAQEHELFCLNLCQIN